MALDFSRWCQRNQFYVHVYKLLSVTVIVSLDHMKKLYWLWWTCFVVQATVIKDILQLKPPKIQTANRFCRLSSRWAASFVIGLHCITIKHTRDNKFQSVRCVCIRLNSNSIFCTIYFSLVHFRRFMMPTRNLVGFILTDKGSKGFPTIQHFKITLLQRNALNQSHYLWKSPRPINMNQDKVLQN